MRKPSSDNPEILRFFRYMKAAKDGQDNQDCSLVYSTCTQSDAAQASPMAHTFQDINKLVQARRLARTMAAGDAKEKDIPKEEKDAAKEKDTAKEEKDTPEAKHPAPPAA